MIRRSQIPFTQGGKGGVGKTTVISALTAWVRAKGFDPVLLDFDTENRDESSFQSFIRTHKKSISTLQILLIEYSIFLRSRALLSLPIKAPAREQKPFPGLIEQRKLCVNSRT